MGELVVFFPELVMRNELFEMDWAYPRSSPKSVFKSHVSLIISSLDECLQGIICLSLSLTFSSVGRELLTTVLKIDFKLRNKRTSMGVLYHWNIVHLDV